MANIIPKCPDTHRCNSIKFWKKLFFLLWEILVLKERVLTMPVFSATDPIWTMGYGGQASRLTSWLQVKFGCVIELELERLSWQLHKKRDSVGSFLSTFSRSQSSFPTQYFWPHSLQSTSILFLTEDLHRQWEHEGDKFHLTFRHQWKALWDCVRRGEQKFLYSLSKSRTCFWNLPSPGETEKKKNNILLFPWML
jgi:hypothetical protein